MFLQHHVAWKQGFRVFAINSYAFANLDLLGVGLKSVHFNNLLKPWKIICDDKKNLLLMTSGCKTFLVIQPSCTLSEVLYFFAPLFLLHAWYENLLLMIHMAVKRSLSSSHPALWEKYCTILHVSTKFALRYESSTLYMELRSPLFQSLSVSE